MTYRHISRKLLNILRIRRPPSTRITIAAGFSHLMGYQTQNTAKNFEHVILRRIRQRALTENRYPGYACDNPKSRMHVQLRVNRWPQASFPRADIHAYLNMAIDTFEQRKCDVQHESRRIPTGRKNQERKVKLAPQARDRSSRTSLRRSAICCSTLLEFLNNFKWPEFRACMISKAGLVHKYWRRTARKAVKNR